MLIKNVVRLGMAWLLLLVVARAAPEPGSAAPSRSVRLPGTDAILQVKAKQRPRRDVEVTPGPEKPLLVGSTTIITDVLRTMVGPDFRCKSFIPVGQDIHRFEPSSENLAELEEAELVFINGFDLEAHLMIHLKSVPEEKVVDLSSRIYPRHLRGPNQDDAQAPVIDPHVWGDPANVQVWVTTMAKHLMRIDPEHSNRYAAYSIEFRKHLEKLATEIQINLVTVPAAKRRLVTDHDMLGYFCDAFRVRNDLIVSHAFSPDAAPAAAEKARWMDALKQQSIHTLLVTSSAPSDACRSLADEAGLEITTIDFESIDSNKKRYTNMMYELAAAVFAAMD